MYNDEDAIWSLLLASGYLKVDSMDICVSTGEQKYELSLTNLEVRVMFQKLIKGWFGRTNGASDEFVDALLNGDIKAMNYYMNKIALATFSYFDVGNKPSEYIEPERLASCYDCKGVANGSSLNESSNLYAMTRQSSRFYHGFVLGLMVGQREDYAIKSNRESGFGRYDIIMLPCNIENKRLPAIVIEFKVHDSDEEKSLADTVAVAHKQIEEKRYDEEILALGIEKERIRHYGFAFEGKKVLIG